MFIIVVKTIVNINVPTILKATMAAVESSLSDSSACVKEAGAVYTPKVLLFNEFIYRVEQK